MRYMPFSKVGHVAYQSKGHNDNNNPLGKRKISILFLNQNVCNFS